MALEPGDTLSGGSLVETRDRTDAVSDGDAVEISTGEMDAGVEGDSFVGIATTNGLALSGCVVANVDPTANDSEPVGDFAVGKSLSLSATAGALAVETENQGTETEPNWVEHPGPVTPLSDVGGTWQGQDVPDGYAVVHVNFHR